VGETGVFNQLFASMNDVLDEIKRQYPAAHGEERKELEEQLVVLKTMSDNCIEQWLQFEEKLEQLITILEPAGFEKSASYPMPTQSPIHEDSNSFLRGQGYYQLWMYDHAIREFEAAVEDHPDHLLSRLYLALGRLRKGDHVEAYRHFQLLISLSDNPKVKAIAYNAMGCIQARNKHVEKAQQYFEMAYQADPSFMQPLMNMSLTIQEEERLLSESGLLNLH
jgi:tetratricopeptide (TPR) repeat protein